MHNFQKTRKSDPKKKRIRLSQKEWSKLREQVWHEQAGRCANPKCRQWVPLHGDTIFNTAHLAHIKGKGAGGDDIRSNVQILCYRCHILEDYRLHDAESEE